MLVLSSPGFPFTTVAVMFVTYCLIQTIKEWERRQALLDDPDPLPPAPPSPATLFVTTASPAQDTPTAALPIAESGKKKAE